MSEYICTYMPDNWGEKYIPHLGEEIVRCRDCRHFNDYHGKCHRQAGVLIDDYGTRRIEDLTDMLVLYDAEPYGFCAWAERKVDGDDR